MPTDQQQARDLFLAAVALASDERASFLTKACGADAQLRSAVERLLRAHAEPDTLLEPAAPIGTMASDAPQLGTRIADRYELIEIIGEGGMGTVYRANQIEPVKRQVALKLIRRGFDSKAVLARFDAERQALALMDHPHIARVYDGGSTPTGEPFFVMELVTGVALTEYCDANKLSVDARLKLFVSTCEAVQHAHQKGVIHRDLKPGNVLVTEVDGRPMPKVIDFGVAKATEQKLTDLSFSDLGSIVGTPAYMSPEQADPNCEDVDTRSDVYALGVILYELLTGSPPLGGNDFQRGAILEMLRMVRDVEPPRPSTRVSTADGLPSIAANRNIEPARLARMIKGELDWVVMKALEKDRARRYDTAIGLAQDIQRYLADEVVEAKPMSNSYRLRKFVRRHRVQVTAAVLLLLTLVGGVVGTSLGMVRAERAADQERLAKLDAQAARATAEQSAQTAGIQATLALNSVQSLISQANDKLQGPGLQEVRQTLLEVALANVDKVADVYDKDPSSKEATTAVALVSLGDIYRQLGQSEKASHNFLKALDITKERIAIKHGSDAARRNLALVYSNLAATAEELNRDMHAALDYYLKALALYQDIDEHPMLADSPMPRPMIRAGLAEAQKLVGVMYYRLGRLDEALAYFQKAYDISRELAEAQPNDKSLQVTWTKSALALGTTAFRTGDRKRSSTYLSEARARAQAVLTTNPSDLLAKSNQADVLYVCGETHAFVGEITEARTDMQDCLALYEAISAAEPRNVYLQRNLSKACYRLGNFDFVEQTPDGGRAQFDRALNIRTTGVAISKDNVRRQMELMLAQAQVGHVDDAMAIADRLAAGSKVDPELRVDLARCYAVASRTTNVGEAQRSEALRQKALESLRAAVRDGYRDRVYVECEPDLTPLRTLGEFKTLLEEMSGH